MAFGPESFFRDEAAPVDVSRSFSIRNPNTTYTLRLDNGGLNHQLTRVSSAVVTINGVQVVGGNDLNQNVDFLERPVTLQAANEMAVQLRAQPTGTVVLQIIGVDNDLPTITATASPLPNSAGWNNGNVTISFTCSDATSNVTCPAPVSVTTEGASQVVSGTAVDQAQNSATASVTVNLDRTAPIVSILFPVEGDVLTQASQTLSGLASDNLSQVASATCNGSAATISGLTITCPVSLNEGPNTITVTAADRAGNTGSSAVNVTASLPKIVSVSPNTGRAGEAVSVTITGQNTSFTAGAVQASFGSGITVGSSANTADGQLGPLTVTSPTTAVALIAVNRNASVGARTVTVQSGGQQISLANAFTVTQGLPVVTISSPQNLSFTNISPVTVAGTVSDPTATVTVNGIAAPGGGSFVVSVPLVEGNNEITAVARTASGLTGTGTIQVTLDTTPPRVTIYAPGPNTSTTAASVAVSGIINDLVVGTVNDQQATVTVNGIAAQVANRSFLASAIPLSLGDNLIQVTGRDRSGNGATATVTVRRVNPGEPEVRMVSGNNQSGAASSQLGQPLVVQLVDAAGMPQGNRPVVFKVVQNNGSLEAVSGGGSSFQNGGGTQSLIANTDAQGQASVRWRLGSRSGAGNNRVEASAAGHLGPAVFTATGVPGAAGKIVVDAGSSQTGAIGQALPHPLVVVVTDAGNNRLANVPVTFRVLEGGGLFAGQTTTTQNTDSDGRALGVLTLGPLEGIANHLVQATFPGLTGIGARFTASALRPGDPASTRISGVVLDNSNLPIPGVTVRLYQPYQGQANNVPVAAADPVQADGQGQFVIQAAPVGKFKLFIDGGTAQRPGTWPTLEYDLVTVAGQNNTVGLPIYLLPLDSVNKLCVTETTGGTLTLPQWPGFSMTVAPGSARFPGNSLTGCITVTPVHIDKVPMVPGFGQQPRFVVTIQPVGTTFNPPAAVTFPNVDGLKPREVTELYSFDHELNTFVAIGTGTVTDDGLLLRSDVGVGILKAGWNCAGNPTPTGDCAPIFVFLVAPATAEVGTTVDLTAVGSPPNGGQYLGWTIVDDPNDPTDDPSAAALTSTPSCPGQAFCIAQLEGTKPRVVTAQVSFAQGNNPPAKSNLVKVKFDVKVKLIELTYSGATFRTVHRDNGEAYGTPQWKDANENGTATDEGDNRFPVCYIRDSPLAVSARFRLSKSLPSMPVKIIGEEPGGRKITGDGTVSGTILTMDPTVSTGNIATTIKRFEAYVIRWKVSFDNGVSFIEAGASNNRLYVTLEPPVAPVLYETWIMHRIHLVLSVGWVFEQPCC